MTQRSSAQSLLPQKRIPVVIMDSAQGEPVKDFEHRIDQQPPRWRNGWRAVAKLLDGKGKVVLFRFNQGSASAGQREAGFLEEIKKFPDIQVILDNRYSGTTAREAQSTRWTKGRIFCSTEPSTFGMLSALKRHNLSGSKKVVGFDTRRRDLWKA